MAKFNILESEGGSIINTIKADHEFVEANFDFYEEVTATVRPVPTAEESARMWRDMELSSSDYIVPLTDHPQRDAYMTYRAALRDWPSTADFPNTRPTLGS